MARRKSATPRANLQVEMPTTLVAALDLLAARANRGAGVTRSQLVRAVLAEYVELKIGPDLRKAIAAWDKHGGDMMMQFLKQAIPSIPEESVGEDPMQAKNYNVDPLNDEDPLHEIIEHDAERRQDSPQSTSKGGNRSGSESSPQGESIEPEFANQNGLTPPKPTESEYVAADPEHRAEEPLPEHFPIRSDFEAPPAQSSRTFQAFDP